MNGSGSSFYSAMIDDLDIEPPQKAKTNSQYSHNQWSTKRVALYTASLLYTKAVPESVEFIIAHTYK